MVATGYPNVAMVVTTPPTATAAFVRLPPTDSNDRADGLSTAQGCSRSTSTMTSAERHSIQNMATTTPAARTAWTKLLAPGNNASQGSSNLNAPTAQSSVSAGPIRCSNRSSTVVRVRLNHK